MANRHNKFFLAVERTCLCFLPYPRCVLGFLNHVQVNVALTITGSNMSHIDFV